MPLSKEVMKYLFQNALKEFRNKTERKVVSPNETLYEKLPILMASVLNVSRRHKKLNTSEFTQFFSYKNFL